MKTPYFNNVGERTTDTLYRNFFPGSFNPPHAGHFYIGDRMVFLITVDPPHKPKLTPSDIVRRAKLLEGYNVGFSFGDGLFIEKFRRHPNSNFHVGADTLERLLDPKWGPGQNEIYNSMKENNITLYVYDRVVENKLLTLYNVGLEISDQSKFIRRVVPEPFLGHSSTKIREGQCHNESRTITENK